MNTGTQPSAASNQKVNGAPPTTTPVSDQIATISMPWLPKGEHIIREVEPVGTTAPTLAKILCHSVTSPDVVCKSAVPIFKGNVADEVARLRDAIVTGDQETEFDPGDEEALNGSIPDDDAKLWYVQATRRDSIFYVVAHWFTTEGTVQSATFLLGLSKSPHTRRMCRTIQSYLSKPENFRQFLKSRAWLDSQIQQRADIVWAESPVGRVSSNAALLVYFDKALAIACLERNRFNRPVDVGHVGRLVVEMSQGNWTRGASNICFDVGGHLIDGQHRISAMILATLPIGGVNYTTGLAFGHALADVKNMNANAKDRTMSDNYDINQRKQTELGIVEESDQDLRGLPLGKEFKQIAGKVIYMETDKYIFNTAAMQDAVLTEYYDGLRETRTLAHLLTSKSDRAGSKIRLADPMVIACMLVAYKKNPERTKLAVQSLLNNEVGAVGTPLHTLNEELTKYDHAKKLDKNPKDLPLSKKILICLFFFQEGQDLLTMKDLDNIVNKETKNATNLRKTAINYFKTILPADHPSGMTHSFIPSAAASWHDQAAKSGG